MTTHLGSSETPKFAGCQFQWNTIWHAKPTWNANSAPDGIYIPCGGWGSIHNVDLLERDLDTTVVTWMNAWVWSAMKHGRVAGPISEDMVSYSLRFDIRTAAPAAVLICTTHHDSAAKTSVKLRFMISLANISNAVRLRRTGRILLTGPRSNER